MSRKVSGAQGIGSTGASRSSEGRTVTNPSRNLFPMPSSPHVVNLISWSDKGLSTCGKFSEFHVLCAFQAE
ncbi:unannotated protein [freshwater metagenome]|uniref:Unannotated protein n=1 Tax=freshwater metagenome TaxID=449393 RepID=A0A6J6ZUS3_9ZZZZ